MCLKLVCRIAGILIIGNRALIAQEVVQPDQATKSATSEKSTAKPLSYIVMFAPGTGKSARLAAAFQAGGTVRYNYDSIDAIAVLLPSEAAAEALKRHPGVVRVTPDFLARGRAKPGTGGGGGTTPIAFDTQQLISYEVQRVGIPAAGSDGDGIGVAVVDTGIDFNHPDLAPAPNASGTAFNALNPGASCQDDGGHGTHISGLLAAQNNTIGIVGVAPAAKLYCVKVLDSNITGPDSVIMAGLDWIVQRHNKVSPNIRVVNISFGRPLGTGETMDNSPLRPLIQALYNAGVVVVVAAGNDPNLEISQIIPAAFPEVLTVASTVATNGIRTCLLGGLDQLKSIPADTASGFATDGPGVTISAPGEERTDIVNLGSVGCVGLEYGTISTTLNTGGATRKLVPSVREARGSSFAVPLVCGVISRVLQKQLTRPVGNAAGVEAIRTWLKDNADRAGAAPLDHPWAGVIYNYTFDGVREGIAQAPK